MKKSALILNVILSVAVVVLYVLYFTGRGTASPAAAPGGSDTLHRGGAGLNIVYVNIDTIMANYDMSVDLQARLQKKQQDSESKLNARGQKWQNKVNEFQNNLQRGLVTRSEAQKIQKELEQEQQQLLNMRNELANSLMEEQQVSTRKVMYSIIDYLNDFCREHNYQYVLGTTVGGVVLYGEKRLDVTQEVLAGLNERYKSVRDSLLKAQ